MPPRRDFESPKERPKKKSPKEKLAELRREVPPAPLYAENEPSGRPTPEDYGFPPPEEDISDAMPPGIDYNPPQPRPRPKPRPDETDEGGIEKQEGEPWDPRLRAQNIKELKEVFREEYDSGPGNYEEKEQYFRDMISQHVQYFYHLALLNNWGKEGTKRALREQARRFRDEMKDEPVSDEVKHIMRDLWHGEPKKMPKSLAKNPHLRPGVDLNKLRQRKQAIERVLVNTIAKNWFIPRYVKKTVTKSWYTLGRGDRPVVKRPESEFKGHDEGYINVINPLDFEISFSSGITFARMKMPLPWGDKMPRKVMEDEIISFYAKALAAKAVVSVLEGRPLSQKDIAEKFLNILIASFKETLRPDHQDTFEKWVRDEQNVVDDDECKPLCSWDSKISWIAARIPTS